jgi:hypothetical protein
VSKLVKVDGRRQPDEATCEKRCEGGEEGEIRTDSVPSLFELPYHPLSRTKHAFIALKRSSHPSPFCARAHVTYSSRAAAANYIQVVELTYPALSS